MAVTSESFLLQFPMFASADQDGPLIDAEIVAASRLLNATIWGDHFDDGLMNLVAHRIAIKLPTFSQLVDKQGGTRFFSEFERLKKELLVADRVP